MKPSEAARLMTRLFAFFPGAPSDTFLAYTAELEHEEVGDVDRAIDLLISRYDRLPSLHQVLETLREVKQVTYSPAPLYTLPAEVADREAIEAIFRDFFDRHPAADSARWQQAHPSETNWDKSRARARQLLTEWALDNGISENRPEPSLDATGRLKTVAHGNVAPAVRKEGGPGCHLCGRSTINNGGYCWFCPSDGFVVPERGVTFGA